MIKIQGCCLRTVEEQRIYYDENPIDPNIVEIPSYTQILQDFNHGPKPDAGGVVRLHEGRLWFDGSIPDHWPKTGYLAIGYITDGTKVVLTEVSITQKPKDKGGWKFEILEKEERDTVV